MKLGQLNMAGEVYKEMLEFNIEPDVFFLWSVEPDVLINAFADAGNFREARSYVEIIYTS